MKSSWIGIGFSHHSVPSLSNTATRSSTGTVGPGALDEVDDRLVRRRVPPTGQSHCGVGRGHERNLRARVRRLLTWPRVIESKPLATR